MTTLRALVIEDHPPDSALIAATISRAGFCVESTTLGVEGLKLITEQDYHLVLVDLCLPDIDGFELLQALRGTENGAKVKLICYSASDDKDTISGAVAHGADDFFQKGAHKIPLLETRFRGLAHKLMREERTEHRLELLEQGFAEAREILNRVAINTEPVKDLGEAWDSTKGFVRMLAAVGGAIDKTKYVWGPIVALVIWIKTGVLTWNSPKQ